MSFNESDFFKTSHPDSEKARVVVSYGQNKTEIAQCLDNASQKVQQLETDVQTKLSKNLKASSINEVISLVLKHTPLTESVEMEVLLAQLGADLTTLIKLNGATGHLDKIPRYLHKDFLSPSSFGLSQAKQVLDRLLKERPFSFIPPMPGTAAAQQAWYRDLARTSVAIGERDISSPDKAFMQIQDRFHPIWSQVLKAVEGIGVLPIDRTLSGSLSDVDILRDIEMIWLNQVFKDPANALNEKSIVEKEAQGVNPLLIEIRKKHFTRELDGYFDRLKHLFLDDPRTPEEWFQDLQAVGTSIDTSYIATHNFADLAALIGSRDDFNKIYGPIHFVADRMNVRLIGERGNPKIIDLRPLWGYPALARELEEWRMVRSLNIGDIKEQLAAKSDQASEHKPRMNRVVWALEDLQTRTLEKETNVFGQFLASKAVVLDITSATSFDRWLALKDYLRSDRSVEESELEAFEQDTFRK